MRPPGVPGARPSATSDDRSAGLVPVDPSRFPRPNPGPEPWADPSATRGGLRPWAPASGLALAVALILGAGIALRRRARRSPGSAPPSTEAGPSPPGRDDARRRLIALSAAAREALARRFGPGWASRTTEEVAADPDLVALLGDDQARTLARFLADADRAKFADAEPGEDWGPWASGLPGRLDPPPPAIRQAGPRPHPRSG